VVSESQVPVVHTPKEFYGTETRTRQTANEEQKGLSVANYKIGLNSGIFGDFDTMPACATSSSFSFIRSSLSSGL
jgi:hypothetical protein